jgi:hypothetical protein
MNSGSEPTKPVGLQTGKTRVSILELPTGARETIAEDEPTRRLD